MAFSWKAPKRYLVTGGCGFIGSHLADALIDDGHSVVILDNLSTGKRENAHPDADLVIGDTTNYPTVARALDGVDGCFHLAAVASVEKSTLDWARTHSVNITSTVNLFEAASKGHKIPIVYTSSAAVYGNCSIIPTPEDAMARPLTAYGADKLGCDLHGHVAWEVHGVPNIGLRPFNVYGPRQDPSSPYSGVISIFTDRMQRGLPVTIFGDGNQVRDFVYVGDAVASFKAAMRVLQASANTPGHDTVNLCTGRPTTINELAEAIAAITQYPQRPQYAPARKGDIRVSIGNPSRLAARLGLKLRVTLREGLQRMLLPHVPVQAQANSLLR